MGRWAEGAARTQVAACSMTEAGAEFRRRGASFVTCLPRRVVRDWRLRGCGLRNPFPRVAGGWAFFGGPGLFGNMERNALLIFLLIVMGNVSIEFPGVCVSLKAPHFQKTHKKEEESTQHSPPLGRWDNSLRECTPRPAPRIWAHLQAAWPNKVCF